MSAEIIRLPYSVTRRVSAQKPRRSKNGTLEERAAKAAPLEAPPGVVLMSDVREQAHSGVDGRTLRVSPLRDCVALVSFGACRENACGWIKGGPLVEVQPEIREEWLEALGRAIKAVEIVGIGLVEARHTLLQLKSFRST
jgi:hypothetical protein